MFRGIARGKLADIIGVTKLHFLKYPKDEIIARQGDECQYVSFVLNGCVRTESVNRNGRFSVSQTLEAPAILAPDFLFGRRTVYPYTIEAESGVSVMQISKNDFVKLLRDDEIFLFNYLNMLSANAQKSVEGLLSLTEASLEERVAFWVISLTQPQGVNIRLDCRVRDLCALFNVQRNVFESTMEQMKAAGLIDFSATSIEVRSRRELSNLLERQHE